MQEPAASQSDLLEAIDGVEGWLTPGQATCLFEAAQRVPEGGRIVEIGSFRGRSTIALALGAAPGVEVVAIDPHAGNDRGPQEISGFADAAESDHEVFLANLEKAGVRDRVRVVRKFSGEAHDDVAGPLDLLWVDGAHRFGPAHDDLRRWGARVVPGGQMGVHDSWCSIGVTLATLAEVTTKGGWRYEGRESSLALYTREPASLANRGRQLAELGWFAGNVGRKVSILVTRKDAPWPY